MSHTVYWEDSGAPVPHTFSNVGGLLTFDNFPIVPAGKQFVIEITVVLDDTPANAIGNAVRQHGQVGFRATHRRRVL